MLSDHLFQLILQNIGHLPTPGQEKLSRLLAEFALQLNESGVFLVKGFAGTGKTTLISSYVKALDALNIKTLLLAPTGRAAKVFSSYAGKPAYTIHRKIYRQKSSNDGFGAFVLGKNLFSQLIILVDEASMISDSMSEDKVFGSGRLLADLITYVRDGSNCKLVLIGDTAQLPPVGLSVSPALNKNEMAMYMPVRGEATLTDIVRQNRDSGILENATIVRSHITLGKLLAPQLKKYPQADIHFIDGRDLTEWIEKSYDIYGMEEVMVLCRSNKRANQYNEGIRKQVLYREEEVTKGDLLMVVKNNYTWLKDQPEIDFIANGDILRVVKVNKNVERYGFRFAFAHLTMIDYEIEFDAWIILDTLNIDSAAMGKEAFYKLYNSVLEDYSDLTPRNKQYRAVKEDPFFNALQVKFAYAVTCHKAQGGQWKSVFIDQGYVNSEKIDLEYLRWLYTAITRATEELYLVNFPENMVKNQPDS